MKNKLTVADNPSLLSEWSFEKNIELKPEDATLGSRQKVWWKCKKFEDHIWLATIESRKRHNCPCCNGKKVVKSNCLATLFPNLVKIWHPTKNTITPHDVTPKSDKRVWWKCPIADDHEWVSTVKDRTSSTSNQGGCPYCLNQKVSISNCLATTHPSALNLWNFDKNTITPYQVVAGALHKNRRFRAEYLCN